MNDNEIIQQYKKYEPFFGSWYIKRFIGEGGFAKVFEIVRNDFGREYVSALKIIAVSKTKSEINTLKSEGMSDEDIRGYMRGIVEDTIGEIQLMYKLRGKGNIVSYEDHAAVEHEDGMGWDILIKMEYLTSLSTYIRQQKGCLAKRDIIKLGVDICKALEACQRYNIIHRDIKADNIFISDDGEFKLGDFGIARVIERKDQTLSKKGTSAYMAPEVYKGQTYTSAVDIYSLGMVMYRLMNNNRGPFLPPYPQPMSLDDRDHAMMLRMSGERFSRPSQVTRGRLVEIVMKACSYRPEERYSSPGFMRQELKAIYLDTDEMTTEERVIIYDAEGRNMHSSPSSVSSQSGIPVPGTPESAGVTQAHKEEAATEVLREEDATEVLRGDATEVLREEGATEVLKGDATEVLREVHVSAPAQSMLSRARKLCIKCGNSIEHNAIFCSFCGASQQEKPEERMPLEKSISSSAGEASNQNILMAEWIEPKETDWFLNTDIVRNNIRSVTFLDSLDQMPSYARDVSADGSGKVMAWTMWRERSFGCTYYDLFIGGEGGVVANENSSYLFAQMSSLKQVHMRGCFFTNNVSKMYRMFSGCISLTDLDISEFDTSKVTDMSYMFSCCSNLVGINVSGFHISEETLVKGMFEICRSLTDIDVSNFTSKQVSEMLIPAGVTMK